MLITNVEVSVITPIAFDHCAVLGNTIAEIAQENAGIIKKGVPVVSASQVKEAREVIERTGKRKRRFGFFLQRGQSRATMPVLATGVSII